MNTYFIGIDGGGTKTEAVLCTDDGNILSRSVTGPANLNGTHIETVRNNISTAISELLEAAKLSAHDITSVFAGIAGGINNRSAINNILREQFPEFNVLDNNSDAFNILNCGLLNSDGCCIISGTGSSCFVRRDDRYTQIGGWGYLIDKRGSGFDIGRDCIDAILKAHDGRGQKTLMSGLYTETFGIPAEKEISRIYSLGRTFIASAAPLVFRAAIECDEIACHIIEENMEGLAEYVKAAAKHFKKNELPFITIISGGIFNNKNALDLLKKMTVSNTLLRPLECAPVFGAVVQAMKLAGITANFNMQRNFINSHKS